MKSSFFAFAIFTGTGTNVSRYEIIFSNTSKAKILSCMWFCEKDKYMLPVFIIEASDTCTYGVTGY
jgi:hypothetical protein